MELYSSSFSKSVEEPNEFWKLVDSKKETGIHWYVRPSQVNRPFQGIPNHVEWFPDGEMNTCNEALDCHVNLYGRGDQIALIYESPVTSSTQRFTYKEMLEKTELFSRVLVKHGVKKGDRVVIYNPMIPETTFAMLACARIGAIHSVVFGGFVSEELASRIDHSEAKVVVSVNCALEGPNKVIHYKPLLDKALSLAKCQPQSCIIFQRKGLPKASLVPGRDYDWDTEVESVKTKPAVACVRCKSTDPLYILYTSGTTGAPKGVVRDNGGHALALKWSMFNIYGINPGDVWWSASDLGWVVGHSYILYAPLMIGATTVMFEGKPVGTPDAAAFWRVIQKHKVNGLFTAPTAFRAIKREDPDGKLLRRFASDMRVNGFKRLWLAGERADPNTIEWAKTHLGVPVIDHWWMTETGWAITANMAGSNVGGLQDDIPLGSAGRPVPGYNLCVVSDDGSLVSTPGQEGNLVVKLPMPPGTLPTLWKAEDRFIQAYLSQFKGYFLTGDAGFIDDKGCVHVMTRTDDVINVSGHRLSTGMIEEILASHVSVAECCVFGRNDPLKGQIPIAMLVLKAGIPEDEASIRSLQGEVVSMVREKLGAVYCLKDALVIPRLPKTRSGKVLRGTLRKISNGEPYKVPPTIDEPATLGMIADVLSAANLVKRQQSKL